MTRVTEKWGKKIRSERSNQTVNVKRTVEGEGGKEMHE